MNRNIIFFNTSGEVYSINYTTKRINWVLNLKSSSTTGQNTLFLANPMVINDNDIIISSDSALLSYNKITGNTNWQIPITVSPKLDISNNFIFGYTDNKLLTCLKTNGDILWSTKIFNLSSNISPKYDEDEIGTISSLVLANNNIMLFSSKGYLLEFNSKNGQIISINKISKNGFVTDPIFSEGNMMVFNSKYKLLIFN